MADTEVPAPAPGGTSTAVVPPQPQAKVVVYCGACGLPPEYCEFGGTTKKCHDWLESSPHKDLFNAIYSTESSSQQHQQDQQTLSPTALLKASKDAAKKAAKAAAAEEKELLRKQKSKIVLKRVERTKKKYVIVVTGLEQFGLENKKVAKDLGKKFACGSSVVKGPGGIEEIVVQGDLSDDILEFIVERYKDVVPEENFEQVEDKPKKKGGAGPGGGGGGGSAT